jgi:hypothetical protein
MAGQSLSPFHFGLPLYPFQLRLEDERHPGPKYQDTDAPISANSDPHTTKLHNHSGGQERIVIIIVFVIVVTVSVIKVVVSSSLVSWPLSSLSSPPQHPHSTHSTTTLLLPTWRRSVFRGWPWSLTGQLSLSADDAPMSWCRIQSRAGGSVLVTPRRVTHVAAKSRPRLALSLTGQVLSQLLYDAQMTWCCILSQRYMMPK